MDEVRIIRGEAELRAATGLGREKRRELIGQGLFPPYIKLGARARASLATDINTWLTWRAACTVAEAQGEELPPPPKWRLPRSKKLGGGRKS